MKREKCFVCTDLLKRREHSVKKLRVLLLPLFKGNFNKKFTKHCKTVKWFLAGAFHDFPLLP